MADAFGELPRPLTDLAMKPSSYLSIAILIANVLPAQDSLEQMMTPAKETKKFDVFLGSWEGSGTAKGSPDGEAMRFTVTADARRVLGGHFVREDSLFTFVGMEGSSIAFRSYHGWDRENKRYMSIQMGNDGSVQTTEMDWVDDKTIVSGNKVKMAGQVFYERYVVNFAEKDRYTLVGHRSVGAGKPFVHIQGEYRRKTLTIANASVRPKPLPIESQGAFGPTAKALPFARRIAGHYRMKGSMIPAPGAPKMTISAEEIVKPIFGDSILLFRTKGEPSGGFSYEGVSALAFDPVGNRHKMVYVNNPEPFRPRSSATSRRL